MNRPLLIAALLLSACRGQTSTEPPIVPFRGMHSMPRYDHQSHVDYFPDHRAMRPPVEGAVPREQSADLEYSSGKDNTGRYLLTIPQEARRVANEQAIARGACSAETGAVGCSDQAFVERGRERYGIYCASCHGLSGDGNGIISQRAAAAGTAFQAQNLHGDAYLHYPDGRLFWTITNGWNTMPAYYGQIPAQDRWSIVAYVRALQLSQADGSDTDGDGVFGIADRCPTAMPAPNGWNSAEPYTGPAAHVEDRDGFEDTDGCLDWDNDGDQKADPDDGCPTAPGAGADGCPVSVRVDAGHIQILQQIQFDNAAASIKSVSFPILEEVRAVLAVNPSLRVRIEGHTDDAGDDTANLALSDARAASVVRWLVEHGIAADRLQAVGRGESDPIEAITNPSTGAPLPAAALNAARGQNRRVEFDILGNPA